MVEADNPKTDLKKIIFFIFLSFVGICLYLNSLNGVFVFDDLRDIVDNTRLHDISRWTDLLRTYPTRWVVYLTFAINYHLHGLDVFGYHVVNLIVHVLCSFLCYLIACAMMSVPPLNNLNKTKKDLFTMGCALLFIAHPLQTHTVTYVVQRLALMMSFFYLVSIYAYLKMRLSTSNTSSKKRQVLWISIFIGSVIGGVFSKENFFSLPLVLLLVEYTFFSLGNTLKRIVANKRSLSLMIIISAIWVTICITWVAISIDFRSMGGLFIARFYDTGEIITPYQYLLTQFRVIVNYMRLFFIPIKQNADYYVPVSRSLFDYNTWLYALGIGALFVTGIRARKRYPLVCFGVIFFFICLSIESSIIPTLNLMNEYRMYLPVFGLSIACIGFGITVISDRNVKLLRWVLLAAFVLFSLFTINRNRVYSSEVTFWNDVVSKSPQKARAFNGRGVAHMRSGDVESALADFETALRLHPSYATVLYNIAKCHIKKANYTQAIVYLVKALESPYTVITKGQIQMTMGIVYLKQQDPSRALRYFDVALDINPDLFYVYYYRALVYAKLKDFTQAIEQMNTFLKYVWAVEYLNLRGVYYFNDEQYDQALNDFNEALKLSPNDSAIYCNISDVYLKQDDIKKALETIEHAAALNPDFEEVSIKRNALLNDYKNAID